MRLWGGPQSLHFRICFRLRQRLIKTNIDAWETLLYRRARA